MFLFMKSPLQRGLNARKQISQGKRLAEVVVRARVQSALLRVGPVCRNHDDRQVGAGAQSAACLDAIHVRQVPIEHNEVGRRGRNRIQRLGSIRGLDNFVIARAESETEGSAEPRIIVDEQYADHFIPNVLLA